LTLVPPGSYPNFVRTVFDASLWKDRVHVITSIGGLLRTLSSTSIERAENARSVVTGLPAIDALLPGGSFAAGAVHEVLSGTDTPSFLLPILVARAAARLGRVAWCDELRQLYPPAVAALGLPLDRLLVLRPAGPVDALWAMTECLRCRGIGACVAVLPRISRIAARKLQLAAERGGGIGLVLRPAGAVSWPYAAATRWLVRPAVGERRIQRWSVELIHGHGGRVGQSVLLEVCRETHHVRAIEAVVDRQDQTPSATASA
jgi:protein ImuA